MQIAAPLPATEQAYKRKRELHEHGASPALTSHSIRRPSHHDLLFSFSVSVMAPPRGHDAVPRLHDGPLPVALDIVPAQISGESRAVPVEGILMEAAPCRDEVRIM